MPSSAVHREVVLHQTESATVMLSVMIYPSWHWELLWQLAQPKLVASLSLRDTLGCQSSWEESSCFCFLTHKHIFLLIRHLGSELHAAQRILQPREQAPYVQGQFILLIYPPPFPSALPSGVIHSPLLRKLCLNPLLGGAEWPRSIFLGPRLEFLWAPLCGPISPGHFFSSSSGSWDPHLSPSCPPPPSCCLLLFQNLSHELCKHWGFVCSCCGQSVALRQALTEHQFVYGLRRVSGLPLWLTWRDKRAAKRQSHGDWCCLRLMYPPDAHRRILWPQVVACPHFPAVSVAWLTHVSLVPPTGIVGALVRDWNQCKCNPQSH